MARGECRAQRVKALTLCIAANTAYPSRCLVMRSSHTPTRFARSALSTSDAHIALIIKTNSCFAMKFMSTAAHAPETSSRSKCDIMYLRSERMRR